MSHPNAPARVSHYQIIRPLGSGGMGEVYLARDLHLERQVAIKFLNAPADERSRHRLLNEARAAAALEHPLICAVYEVGHDEVGGDYVVMQYAEGETLAARLTRGPLSTPETIRLGIDVAEALSAAHHHGIIHRDLKPQNIVIGLDGRPKLLDFGISKRRTSEREAAEAETSTQLTGPHAMLGTPGYMAPEQVQGQPADARSDLFALGCVLFECLTGRRAFDGQTSGEVFGRVLHVDVPPVSGLMPGVPADLDHVIGRLLEKAPVDRFQTADEVVGALRLLGTRTSGTGMAPVIGAQPLWRRPAVTIGGTAAALLLAAAAWMWFARSPLPEPPVDAARWYDQGVEALREGTYAGARAALEEAVRIYPDYAQAYSRLAEASSELDDERSAQTALLRVASLVPNTARLPEDDRLRLEAVRASVLRDDAAAIAAFTELTERHPTDAGAWLDLGRAEEAAGRIGTARDHYAKAVELDPHYAAAHLRLGNAERQTGQSDEAIAAMDEAIRLYRLTARTEGEAEAWLRKGLVQSGRGRYDDATVSLETVVALAADDRFLHQRLQAEFEMARVTIARGRFADAAVMAQAAVDEATSAGLLSVAAGGLISLSNSLTQRREFGEADRHLEGAIRLAHESGAMRTEMRARLQRAALALNRGKPEEALQYSAEPMRFYHEGRYRHFEAQAKNIVARAHGNLEQYAEGLRLAGEAKAYAESIGDDAILGVALENLAIQFARLGRLPEALEHREHVERLHRSQSNHSLLAFDLPNRAEILVSLGRGADGEALLGEIEQNATRGVPGYGNRQTRLAQVRQLRASIESQWDLVERLAPTAGVVEQSVTLEGSALFALVLREHARAAVGRSRAAPEDIAGWASGTMSAPLRRETAYWVARTLLARRDPGRALAIVAAALADPVTAGNVELRWRLAALAARAVAAGAAHPSGGDFTMRADEDVARITAEWSGHAAAYFARPDLAELRHGR